MFFKPKKEKFFLTLDKTENAEIPPTENTPVVAPPAPAAAPAPAKAKTSIKAKKSAAAPEAVIAAAVQSAPAPASQPKPSPVISEVAYDFFPARRMPGPSLKPFMDIARTLGR